MGTKNNPAIFDCYANADPDEPMFILLGRDPMAPYLVELWAQFRESQNEHPGKVYEARECAAEMRKWLATLGKIEWQRYQPILPNTQEASEQKG